MIKPFQAIYGARNSAHDLLFWDNPNEQPPRSLLGLTDKPPGLLSPQDIWWPAFGCGPIDDWWGMWWVTPDNSAKRKGMVRSKVMLWKRCDVHKVNDLLPFIEDISDRTFIAKETECSLLLATSKALISSDEHQLIALQESNLGYPLLVGLLWKHLWPSAKGSFSTRYGINPPQGTNRQRSCTFYCVPQSHINQWKTENVDVVTDIIDTVDRGVLYLANGNDYTIEKILSEYPPKRAQLKIMSMIARCADRLDMFTQQPTVERALTLLRTLVALYPEKNDATNLKCDALKFISTNIDETHKDRILGLANLDGNSLPSTTLLELPLSKTCGKLFKTLPPENMQPFFKRTSDEEVQTWWKNCIQEELKKTIQEATMSAQRRLLSWLGQDNSLVLLSLIPSDESTEKYLVDSASKNELTANNIKNIQSFAIEMKWSKLFAWCLLNDNSIEDPLVELNKVFGRNSRGHGYLIQHLPIESLVNEILTGSQNVTFEETASRTKNSPDIFLNLDINTSAVMKLWLAHIKAGGAPWPLGIDKEIYARAYLDELMLSNVSDVVNYIAKGIAHAVLHHPKRCSIWALIPRKERECLAREVADAYIISHTETGIDNQQETVLADKIIEKINGKSNIEGTLLLRVLSWPRHFTENMIIKWVDKLPMSQWTIFSKSLGEMIYQHHWITVAEHIYSKCFDTSLSYEQKYIPAILEFVEFLDILKQFRVKCVSNVTLHLAPSELVLVVATIGSTLACNELEEIWIRAGGKIGELKHSNYPNENWLDAATKAEEGKLKSGLLGLVEQLLLSYPYNKDLLEIKNILKN
ncbi:GAP1-N1 domain-containing protein [Celerinatantimonas diazotrophica]|uniref:Uncharacterized protein n=1 Tax=Celerinatantimonas diazotrophica TaxID=412034 RepID=A0A4R1K247_9GAMM|nr:hypothetical protein [Celerinatantimonas diazotrophica]TCK57753.1 hypothetical protein EV690_1447 [Celerinatantimonas diazotrophica]CAG9298185.1 hypothetical protein CEDIAZO_03380 [Celerinatantimonas diazotrophica]